MKETAISKASLNGAAITGTDSADMAADSQIGAGIEAFYFAYRAFTSDPDEILAGMHYGRAHHRALHFIARNPGMTVSGLLDILGVTKQSLNRVLRALVTDGLVEQRIGLQDRRERRLYLKPAGQDLEQRLSQTQRARVQAAYDAAGQHAVEGFRRVLEAMMCETGARKFSELRGGGEAQ